MAEMALFSVIKWPCFQLTKTPHRGRGRGARPFGFPQGKLQRAGGLEEGGQTSASAAHAGKGRAPVSAQVADSIVSSGTPGAQPEAAVDDATDGQLAGAPAISCATPGEAP